MYKKPFFRIIEIVLLLLVCSSSSIIRTTSGSSINQKEKTAKLTSSTENKNRITFWDTLKVGSKTQIIGKCFNHNNKYDLYSFLLKDSTSIVDFAKHIRMGKQVTNFLSGDEFDIYIVNNHLITNYISINPGLNYIRINGIAYYFNFYPLKKLYLKHSLNCDEEKVSFDNKTEFEKYLTEAKKDTNFLYYHAPEFRYDGSFTMSVKKELFSNPNAAMEYLKPEIEKIVKPDEYMIFYMFRAGDVDKVIQNDSYTLTITGTKKLYDNLNVGEFRKNNWVLFGKKTGLFCFKK